VTGKRTTRAPHRPGDLEPLEVADAGPRPRPVAPDHGRPTHRTGSGCRWGVDPVAGPTAHHAPAGPWLGPDGVGVAVSMVHGDLVRRGSHERSVHASHVNGSATRCARAVTGTACCRKVRRIVRSGQSSSRPRGWRTRDQIDGLVAGPSCRCRSQLTIPTARRVRCRSLSGPPGALASRTARSDLLEPRWALLVGRDRHTCPGEGDNGGLPRAIENAKRPEHGPHGQCPPTPLSRRQRRSQS